MMALLVVLLLAPIVGFCILGVSMVVALVVSYGPTSQRLALLSQARRVRLEIKSQPGLNGRAAKTSTNNKKEKGGDLEVKLRVERDWSKASGWYQSKKHSETGKIALEFVPFDSVFLKTGNTVWSVGGRSEDGSFQILHGLIAENGKLYWLESHRNTNSWLKNDSATDGYGPSFLGRMVLVEGVLDFDRRQFMGTWTDNLGGKGAYQALERRAGITAVPTKSRIPIDFIEFGCGGDFGCTGDEITVVGV